MLDTDRLAKILATIPVAKSRRQNSLTQAEIGKIVDKISEEADELFVPDEPVSWYGLDYVNSMTYEGDTADDVVQSWKENNDITDEVLNIALGDGAEVYQRITGVDSREELFLFRSDVLPAWKLEVDSEGNVSQIEG